MTNEAICCLHCAFFDRIDGFTGYCDHDRTMVFVSDVCHIPGMLKDKEKRAALTAQQGAVANGNGEGNEEK